MIELKKGLCAVTRRSVFEPALTCVSPNKHTWDRTSGRIHELT